MTSAFRYATLNFLFCLSLLAISSCNTAKNIDKDFLYFQTEKDDIGVAGFKERVIGVNDILSIQVISKSLNQQEAALFNTPAVSISSTATSPSAGPGNTYIVDLNGNIELPIIGEVQAGGLTRDQLKIVLEDKIKTYVKDPSVSIRSMNFTVNVLGEVRQPGAKIFLTDKVTIIDAISAAGDLTETGKRKDILVIRDDGGRKLYIEVDITSGSLFQSTAYQLQPNDIVYVGANLKKLKLLARDPSAGAAFRTVGTALSILLSLLNLYFRL